MPSLYWKTDLGCQPVLVASGRFVSVEGEIAAASGKQVFLLVPEKGEYRTDSVHDLAEDARCLAPVRYGAGRDFVAACTSCGITVLGCEEGSIFPLCQYHNNPGADFHGLACGDLDGDGRNEIIAFAAGPGEIHIYRLKDGGGVPSALVKAGSQRIPGAACFTGLIKEPGKAAIVVAAYQRGGLYGLARFKVSRHGLTGELVMEANMPQVTSFAPGFFTGRGGTEVAVGGPGGMVWIIGAAENGGIRMVTRSLGEAVTVLAEANPEASGLLAGTPEGTVYVFDHPVGSNPQYEFSPVEGVAGLSALPERRLAVGTSPGGLQVWSLDEGEEIKYIARPGDTLSSITIRFNVTLDQILSLNPNIMGGVLMPGQVLRIPTSAGRQ